jgi:hypothetical protein
MYKKKFLEMAILLSPSVIASTCSRPRVVELGAMAGFEISQKAGLSAPL